MSHETFKVFRTHFLLDSVRPIGVFFQIPIKYLICLGMILSDFEPNGNLILNFKTQYSICIVLSPWLSGYTKWSNEKQPLSFSYSFWVNVVTILKFKYEREWLIHVLKEHKFIFQVSFDFSNLLEQLMRKHLTNIVHYK